VGGSSCYKLMLHYIFRQKIEMVHFQQPSLQITNKWPLFTAVCWQDIYSSPASKFNSVESEMDEVFWSKNLTDLEWVRMGMQCFLWRELKLDVPFPQNCDTFSAFVNRLTYLIIIIRNTQIHYYINFKSIKTLVEIQWNVFSFLLSSHLSRRLSRS